MTVYRKIQPEFWTGRTGRQLRGQADLQLVAMYLMTCTHANMIGVFTCPPAYIANDLGMPFEGASKALQSLSEGGFCAYDADLDLVWVKEMARFQVGDELKSTDNQVKSIRSFYRAIPNPLIRRAFFERYGVAYHLEEIAEDLEITRALEGASKPLRSQEQEQEQYQEQDSCSQLRSEHDARAVDPIIAPALDLDGTGRSLVLTARAQPASIKRKSRKAPPTDAERAEFEAWWRCYDNRVGKPVALDAFLAIRREAEAPSLDLLCACASAYFVWLSTEQQRGRDISPCNPSTWLNQRRWEDQRWASMTPINQPRGQWSSTASALSSLDYEEEF